MSGASRIITGILLILFGIVLSFIPLFITGNYSPVILGVLSLIFGVIILLNKKEDKIEEIKKK